MTGTSLLVWPAHLRHAGLVNPVFRQLRQFAQRRSGIAALWLSVLMLLLGGSRFEFHAHVHAADGDGAGDDLHFSIAHDADAHHGEATDDKHADPDAPSKDHPTLHLHEVGTLAALATVAGLPPICPVPQFRLALPESSIPEAAHIAPPIRPPIS